MTTDTRPSIAELEERISGDHNARLTREQTKTLLAIAKAALAHMKAHDNEVLSGDAYYKPVAETRCWLRAALQAVRL